MDFICFSLLHIPIFMNTVYGNFRIFVSHMYERGLSQKTPEFIYKRLCIYSYMFKPQSPSKNSPFVLIHLLRFFPLLKTVFWTCQLWCLLVLLLFFVLPLPHGQKVSLWGLFSSEEIKKKVTWGETEWIGSVQHRGHAVLGQRLLNTQYDVGRCACKSSIMKWAIALRELKKKKKNHTEAQLSLSQQCQLVRW